ncbi:MAG TPA: hypothetical protein VFW11_00355 [Cyclobacteriaceae bacterium]|nr:hypothetical protein [Cyclobacteriaceae bacterium]
MKLLLVTSLKEYQKTTAAIMDQAGIEVFSISETIGFRDNQKPNLLDSWFSSGGEQFDSIFLFSFTEQSKAERAMELIKRYNEANETGFPIRAFIVPVDQASYSIAS